MIYTLIGSTRFQKEFMEVERDLTLDGHLVFGLGVFGGRDLPDYDWERDTFNYIPNLTSLALQKILYSDIVLVVDIANYIGNATKIQIAFAKSQGKSIRYLSNIKSNSFPLLDAKLHLPGSDVNLTLCGHPRERRFIATNKLFEPRIFNEKNDGPCFGCRTLMESDAAEPVFPQPWTDEPGEIDETIRDAVDKILPPEDDNGETTPN